jgi:transcription initiation factor TFIIIB Brf1 subunit/transcription initiation factor TFIIB
MGSRCPKCNADIARRKAVGWDESPTGRRVCPDCGTVHPEDQRDWDAVGFEVVGDD